MTDPTDGGLPPHNAPAADTPAPDTAAAAYDKPACNNPAFVNPALNAPSPEAAAPEETATGAPGMPIPTVADRDGGVARRLTRRCRIAGCVLTIAAGAGVLLCALRAWTTLSVIAALLAAGALVGAAMLFRRAGLWSSVASCPLPGTVGSLAIVGPPQRLSPGLAGAPIKRKLGATVVPIRAVVDPQPGGGALVVHTRADGLQLAAGDRVGVWRATRGALGSIAAGLGVGEPGGDPPKESVTSGRFVLYRPRDHAVFLATTRLSDTW